MIEFIKEATATVLGGDDKDLLKGVACAVLTSVQENINPFGVIYDVAELAQLFRESFRYAAEKNVGKSTPLDFSECYDTVAGGNQTLYLRNYQNYFGPIE